MPVTWPMPPPASWQAAAASEHADDRARHRDCTRGRGVRCRGTQRGARDGLSATARATAHPGAGVPAGPRMPVGLQTLAMMTRQRPYLERCRRRYGSLFTVRVIGFGATVVVSDPALVKEVFRADPAVLHAGTGSPLARTARAQLAVGDRRGPAHGAAQAAAAAVQGRADAELRADDRRDRRRGDRELARGRRVRDDAADATDHAARDSAGGVRRRRRADAATRTAAATVDRARQPGRARVMAAPRLRAALAVGEVPRAAGADRRDPR